MRIINITGEYINREYYNVRVEIEFDSIRPGVNIETKIGRIDFDIELDVNDIIKISYLPIDEDNCETLEENTGLYYAELIVIINEIQKVEYIPQNFKDALKKEWKEF